MRVLVTGADGQLARAVVNAAPATVMLEACSRGGLDISDRDEVESRLVALKPEVIINCAAYTAVDRAEKEPLAAQYANVDGPRSLAETARQIQARLIHVSTDFVFDGSACVPYKPGAATHPFNVYGVTKRAGEEVVLDALPTASMILRTAWVYASVGNNSVRTMLRLMRERRAVAEEGAAHRLLPNDVAVTPIATRAYPTPARRPPFSVLDTTSLDCLAIERVHWRQRLRNVFAEIANV